MRRLLLLGLALSTLAAPAFAGELAGVTLPDTATVGAQQMVLNGLGVRKKFFIKIYVGGLYLPAKENSADKVLATDGARRMVMSFVYSVSQKQMCDAWDEGLEATSPNPAADVQKAFKTLCTFMEDIPKGNQMVLTYDPASGTAVDVNGKTKGTLPGKATADAILRTWIGAGALPGEDFKKAVLGAS
jgi:hypothetical protein